MSQQIVVTAGEGVDVDRFRVVEIVQSGPIGPSGFDNGATIDLGWTAQPSGGVVTNTGGTDATLTDVDAVNAGLMVPADKTKLDGVTAGAEPNVPTNLGYTAAPSGGTVTSSTGTDATLTDADATNAGLLLPADFTKLGTVQSGAEPNVPTNLSYTAQPSGGVVASSTGTDANLSDVDATNAGLMTPAQSAKLGGISPGAEPNVPTDLAWSPAASGGTVSSSTGTDAALTDATSVNAGLMPPASVTKLDGIQDGAQANVPTNLGWTPAASGGTVTSDTGTDATLTDVTAVNAGLMVPADKTKLDGVEAGAQVNQPVTAPADFTATGTPSDTTFLRGDNQWAVPEGAGGGIPEAPSDGTPYGRQDATWVNVEVAGSAAARMRWVEPYVFGPTYAQHDAVRDSDWSMVVTNPAGTAERAAPQATGAPFDVYTGTLTDVQTPAVSQLFFGQKYTPDTDELIVGYRVYTKAGQFYRVYVILPSGEIHYQLAFTASTTGWVSFTMTPSVVKAGEVFQWVVGVTDPEPGTQAFTGNWDYKKPNNSFAPDPGEAKQNGSSPGVLSISKTDNDTTDRSADLATLQVGDVIRAQGVDWYIQTITDQGTYIDYGVNPAIVLAKTGVTLFEFRNVTGNVLDYGQDVNQWQGSTVVRGLYSITGLANLAEDDNQYGLDVKLQNVSASADWAVVAAGTGGAPVSTKVTAPDDFTATGTASSSTFLRGDNVWATPPGGGSGIPAEIIDAKGDLIAGAAPDTPVRLGVGANGTYLAADSSQPTGLKWETVGTVDLGYTPQPSGGVVTNTGGSDATLTNVDATNAGLQVPGDFLKLNGIESGAQVNVPTNLGYTAAPTDGTVTSSTGTDATIPGTTGTDAGLFLPAEQTKLAGIETGAQVNVGTNLGYTPDAAKGTVTSDTGDNATVPLVAPPNAGLMSPADKTTLDGLPAAADILVQTGATVDQLYAGTGPNVMAQVDGPPFVGRVYEEYAKADGAKVTYDANQTASVSGTHDISGTTPVHVLTMTADTTFTISQLSNAANISTSIFVQFFGAFTPTLPAVTWLGTTPTYSSGMAVTFWKHNTDATIYAVGLSP